MKSILVIVLELAQLLRKHLSQKPEMSMLHILRKLVVSDAMQEGGWKKQAGGKAKPRHWLASSLSFLVKSWLDC